MSNAPIQITNVSPLPGAQLVNELNAALTAVASYFSGTKDPAPNAGPFMRWADTGTGRWRMRNAANTEWIDIGPLSTESAEPIDGALLASQAWVLKKFAALAPWLTFYDAVPVTNVSAGKDICVNGIGICYWDATDGAYFQRQTFSTLVTFTASDSITLPTYVKKVRLSGCAGGGGGGYFGGGGSGASLIDYELDVEPGSVHTITIGGAGVGGNPNGTEGGATRFGALVTLTGGGRGSSAGGAGGTGPAGAIAGQAGLGANSTGAGGSGGSTPFGAGALTNPGGSIGESSPSGYGSGGQGGRGTPGGAGRSGILWVRY